MGLENFYAIYFTVFQDFHAIFYMGFKNFVLFLLHIIREFNAIQSYHLSTDIITLSIGPKILTSGVSVEKGLRKMQMDWQTMYNLLRLLF